MTAAGRLILAGVLLGHSGADLRAAVHKLSVLTTFPAIYCFVANVAGDLAKVENFLPANVEPHDYQFSRTDLQKLSQADLIVLNGLGLETWLERALARSPTAAGLLKISAGLEADLIYSRDEPTGRRTDSALARLQRAARPAIEQIGHRSNGRAVPNPDIWLDPQLAARAVTNILRALQRADPANAAGYAANARRYVARLQQLDSDLQRTLAPVGGAAMVTYHDAFAYFARHYGLEVVGVIEPVADVEPSLKYLADLYRMARVKPVKAIFTEPLVLSRLAGQIGRDLHIPVAPLDTLETGVVQPGTYEEAMRSNGMVLLKFLSSNAASDSP